MVAPSDNLPLTTTCRIEEGGNTRCFTVTVEPFSGVQAQPVSVSASTPAQVAPPTAPVAPPAAPVAPPAAPVAPPAAPAGEEGTIYSSFGGSVQLTDIMVKAGDSVVKGQDVAAVEAMKAIHFIKSQVDGVVVSVHAQIGDEVDSSTPILTISKKV